MGGLASRQRDSMRAAALLQIISAWFLLIQVKESLR